MFMFCLLLNADLLLVPDYHMMDMNIISLVTISLLMVSVYTLQVAAVAADGERFQLLKQDERNMQTSIAASNTGSKRSCRCFAKLLYFLPSSHCPLNNLQTVYRNTKYVIWRREQSKVGGLSHVHDDGKKQEDHISSPDTSYINIAAKTCCSLYHSFPCVFHFV